MRKPIATLEVQGAAKLTKRQIADLCAWLDDQKQSLVRDRVQYDTVYKAKCH